MPYDVRPVVIREHLRIPVKPGHANEFPCGRRVERAAEVLVRLSMILLAMYAARRCQWSDLAIARTTPALFGLFSLITLWAAEAKATLHPRAAAWYVKDDTTFSDTIATVRRVLWSVPNLAISRINQVNVEIPTALLQRLIEAVCYTT